jgi:hypothetical protein
MPATETALIAHLPCHMTRPLTARRAHDTRVWPGKE